MSGESGEGNLGLAGGNEISVTEKPVLVFLDLERWWKYAYECMQEDRLGL